MPTEIVDRIRPTLAPGRHSYMTGPFAPNDDELNATELNARSWGRPYRHSFNMIAHPGAFLFDGILRHDHVSGESQQSLFGEGRYGSKSPMAPCHDAGTGPADEADGHVVSFVTDMKADRSKCVVLGARDLAAGPVARILLPHRISSCTHACRAEASEIGTSSGLTRSRHAA